MPSLLTVLSLGFLLGLLALVSQWTMRRRDALGRPRPFPAWTAMLLVVLALVAAIPGAQRRAHEHRLASVATRLVGHPVSVRCQTTASAMVDLGSELGFVPFDADGRPLPTATIKRDPCRDLRDYLGGSKERPSTRQVMAVHVLTHEAMHMRGETSEAITECEALQRDQLTATLLGAGQAQARRLARSYWLLVYPQMPDDYRTGDCAPGGRLDEGLDSAPWAVR